MNKDQWLTCYIKVFLYIYLRWIPNLGNHNHVRADILLDQFKGRAQDQWVVMIFDPVSVMTLGTFGLIIRHVTNLATLTLI